MEINERFRSAPWYGDEVEVTIGGLGGIGSFAAMLMHKLGWNMLVYEDEDNIVDMTNIGGQLYGEKSIGSNKVEALKNLFKATGHSDSSNVIYMESLFEEKSYASLISVAAFDNMKARRMMYDNWLRTVKHKVSTEVAMFIDPRMTAEQAVLYCITKPSQLKRYEEELFSDDESADLLCSFRATPHCGAMIGAHIVTMICNQIFNKKEHAIREVPFKIKIDLTYGIEWID